MKILALIILCCIYVSTQAQIKFQKYTYSEALKQAKKENKKIVIDFYATWCGPCKMMDRDVFVDEELGSFINENFIPIKVDVDKDGETTLKYNVTAMPTLIFTDENGEEIKRNTGYTSAGELLEMAKKSENPELSKVHSLRKIFNAKGIDDQEVFAQYIMELNNESQYDEMFDRISDYYEQFGELDINNEDDLIVIFHDKDNLESDNVQFFLNNISDLNDDNKNIAANKYQNILRTFIQNLDSLSDDELDEGLHALHEPIKYILSGEESELSFEDFKELIEDALN